MARLAPISHQIWDMKYRLKGVDGAPVDGTIEDTWRRVAETLAAPEVDPAVWERAFYGALADFKFLPAGRILAGAGAERDVTLFNCFVMGIIPDDMGGIFAHLREAALTMQQGGGIGYDFSSLRPKGARVKGVGADASGPLSFMDVWDAMCRTIMSAGYRRGAMMATLSCAHPDIEAFVEAKRESGRLRMFNLSVLVDDAFIQAVREDGAWDLVFAGVTYKTTRARDLWDKIMRATYAYAEPGVIFIDRINSLNNLAYCETIRATNPCGEQPLPPYGACLLGSINLATLVSAPFTANVSLEEAELVELVRLAVRMLDNAIEVSRFPLVAQEQEAKAKRRIGLGVTGLADALIMCGVRYGSRQAVALTGRWMKVFNNAAYLVSTELAAEKGSFPLFQPEKFLGGKFVATLDRDIKAAIAERGMRNALVTSIAPTGTISLLAENVSSGIEPVYAFDYTRHIVMEDGERRAEEVCDYAVQLFRRQFGATAPLTDAFVDAQSLSPGDHVVMQSAVQAHIDSSISKTINCPAELNFDAFKDIYLRAYDMGCKGCTTYRPNSVTGAVLQARAQEPDKAQRELPLEVVPERSDDMYEAGAVVYMTQPLGRPEELPGRTYKLRWPDSAHAIYITVNDIVRDGRRRPFEVFINSKNMEHYAWTVALTRMISAVFRRGGDVAFVVEELKAVFDPRGGQWMDGRYVPSLLAAIGEVIERHMIDIGFLPGGEKAPENVPQEIVQAVGEVGARVSALAGACPKCGVAALIYQEGCDLCTACGYSKCA